MIAAAGWYRLRSDGPNRRTFSGLAVYHPRFFAGSEPGRWRITQLLLDTADRQLVTGELHEGNWHDSGTAARLDTLRQFLTRD